MQSKVKNITFNKTPDGALILRVALGVLLSDYTIEGYTDKVSNERWHMTLDLQTALCGGYIGEIPISPKPIAKYVHYICTGRHLISFLMFYYGERDKRLSKLFGYDVAPQN